MKTHPTLQAAASHACKIAMMVSLLAGWADRAFAFSDAPVSLAGPWRFALDPKDSGAPEKWFQRDLEGRVKLPGSMQEQGFGDLPSVDTKWMGDLNDKTFFTESRYAPYRGTNQFKFPYWLTPTRYYSGAAWYQRDVEIPEDWRGRTVMLRLERPHWETTVWLDDAPVGSMNSLAVPHLHDLGAAATPGKHRLTIRVDNRYVVPVGVNSHSVSDHTQGNWNGIVGAIELVSRPALWIDEMQVSPNRGTKAVQVRVVFARTAEGATETEWTATIRSVGAKSGRGPVIASKTVHAQIGDRARSGGFTIELPLEKGYAEWDEFSPKLFDLEVEATPAGGAVDRRQLRVGLRDVSVAGRQITVNSRPIFLRGTLECCIFPRTGYPATDVASWKRILTVARSHGLNHLRFHSWTPPVAAFDAADEMGFYLYVECPTWANGGTSVGDGLPVDAWIRAEGDRILKEFGNHPSFIMMSYGNEPGGKNQNSFLGNLVKHWKNIDKRRLYTSAAGWPMIPENNFHVTPDARAFPVKARLGETSGDYSAWMAKQSAPVVSHEIGQYCVFPNLDEIPKYDGWLKAGNFEIVRDFMANAGMANQARDFLRASGRLQVLFYKDEIEACLRTPNWAGLQLLDLHDFPGQGTALVGVLDPFWDSKGYVAPAEFRRFCSETVPLARLPKRIWTSSETFKAEIDVAHFGAAALPSQKAKWRIRDSSGHTFESGSLAAKVLPTGRLTRWGEITVPLGKLKQATALNLEVSLGRAKFANDWNFWVYPPAAEVVSPAGITVVGSFDDAAARALAEGGRVVVLADPAAVRGKTVGRFDPIFWNKMWFPSQPQHTLGLLLDPKIPLLRGFPTTFHSDWQWQDLQNRSKPMILDAFPKEYRPAVQVIDDWNTCRKLGLVAEARVGAGRLLLCSIDLQRELADRPVARAFKKSLLEYAAGREFDPKTTVAPEQVRALFREPGSASALGATVVGADSEQAGFPASNVIDGDPSTMWHTAWGDGAKPWPHQVTVRFDRPVSLAGLRLVARQDNNLNGWIREYAVLAGDELEKWGAPVATGVLASGAAENEIRFSAPVTCRFLRFVAKSGFDKQPFASLSELEFLTAPQAAAGPSESKAK